MGIFKAGFQRNQRKKEPPGAVQRSDLKFLCLSKQKIWWKPDFLSSHTWSIARMELSHLPKGMVKKLHLLFGRVAGRSGSSQRPPKALKPKCRRVSCQLEQAQAGRLVRMVWIPVSGSVSTWKSRPSFSRSNSGARSTLTPSSRRPRRKSCGNKSDAKDPAFSLVKVAAQKQWPWKDSRRLAQLCPLDNTPSVALEQLNQNARNRVVSALQLLVIGTHITKSSSQRDSITAQLTVWTKKTGGNNGTKNDGEMSNLKKSMVEKLNFSRKMAFSHSQWKLSAKRKLKI